MLLKKINLNQFSSFDQNLRFLHTFNKFNNFSHKENKMVFNPEFLNLKNFSLTLEELEFIHKNKNIKSFPKNFYIELFQLNKEATIKFHKIVKLNEVYNIQLLDISQGFNQLYTGFRQNHEVYFGSYKDHKYLLGDLIPPFKNSHKNQFHHSNSKFLKKTLLIMIRGRLNGVNKARKFRVGNIKTNSISIPLDYSESPIQTK
jgi:hypothetical protein